MDLNRLIKKSFANFRVPFICSVIYFILGNLTGLILINGIIGPDNLLTYLFYPYTVLHIVTAFAGWNFIIFVGQLLSLLIMTIVFYLLNQIRFVI